MSEFRSGKAGDIVSTLVSIYETREVIIQELQTLLASRLLLVKDYDAVKEVSPTQSFHTSKRSSIHGMLVIRTTLTSTAVREAVDGDGDGVVRKRLTQDTHDRALEITVRRGRSARLRCHVERYGGFKEDR